MIKDWIMSHKVQNQEAAELVSALQNSARTPTPEYMDAFFVSYRTFNEQHEWWSSNWQYLCVIFPFNHTISFFVIQELARSDEVTKQWFLNTSAILSFTNLVRKAQVNNDTAHNRYPVHAFGRLSPKNAKAVANKYIPYLQSQLRKAVSQSDSPKIQVYIRALGNTAHPMILSVFEPYLEGT